jgi:DNA-binding CsgD family transcriptional regulator
MTVAPGRRAGPARPDAARDRGLRAAAVIADEADIACDLLLSLHAVRERLSQLEAKLDVRTAAEAVARALGEST